MLIRLSERNIEQAISKVNLRNVYFDLESKIVNKLVTSTRVNGAVLYTHYVTI